MTSVSAEDNQSMRLSNNLSEGSVGRTLFGMALPMGVGLMATMSFNIVDTYFVSGLGESALAALSFTFPIVMAAFSIAIGLGAGASSVIAIAAGKGQRQEVKDLATDCMTLTVIISLVFSCIGLQSIYPFFRVLGATEEVLPLINDYMFTWYIGAVFFITPMVAMSVLRALGNVKVQGSLMIGISIANAVIDPILIFGWWVFPRMELQGAAIASVVVRIVSFYISFYIMHKRIQLFVNPFNLSRFLSSCKKILRVGVPALGANLILPLSGLGIVAVVATYGSDMVAGYGVATRIESMVLIMFFALSAVMGPFCGQNLGANKPLRILSAQNVASKICLLFGLISAVVLAVFGRNFAEIFSDESSVIDTVYNYLLIVPVSYGAYGVLMLVIAAFNGVSKPFPAIIISSTRMIFVLFPLTWILHQILGLYGVFIAIGFANILSGVIAHFWFRAVVKKLI